VNIGGIEITNTIPQPLPVIRLDSGAGQATGVANGVLGAFSSLLDGILNTSAPPSLLTLLPAGHNLVAVFTRQNSTQLVAGAKKSTPGPRDQQESGPAAAQPPASAAAPMLGENPHSPALNAGSVALQPSDTRSPGTNLAAGGRSIVSNHSSAATPVNVPLNPDDNIAFTLRISPEAAQIPDPVAQVEASPKAGFPVRDLSMSLPIVKPGEDQHGIPVPGASSTRRGLSQGPADEVSFPETPAASDVLRQNSATSSPPSGTASIEGNPRNIVDLCGPRPTLEASFVSPPKQDNAELPINFTPPRQADTNDPASPNFPITVRVAPVSPIPASIPLTAAILQSGVDSGSEAAPATAPRSRAGTAASTPDRTGEGRTAAVDKDGPLASTPGQQENQRQPSEPQKQLDLSQNLNQTKAATKESRSASLNTATSLLEGSHIAGQRAAEILAPQSGMATRTSEGQPNETRAPSATALEPEAETANFLPSQPARQISFQLATAGTSKVNVLFTEKDGKVDVAVRTPDRELAKSLQTDLGDLVDRLGHSGFKTETWIPGAHPASGAMGESPGSGSRQGDPNHSGSWAGGRQNPQEQDQSDGRPRPHWLSQLEETLSEEGSRSEDE